MQAGLIGYPLGHSRSPTMQQAAFDALGIGARYILWETPLADLRQRVAGLRAPDILGANVTIPHKTAVMDLLDEVTREAHDVGAVNTVVPAGRPDGSLRLAGYNTDVAAIRRVLAEQAAWEMTVDGRRHLLVLGAGGAARAAVAVGLSAGAEVLVAARRTEAAREMLNGLRQRVWNMDANPTGRAEHKSENDAGGAVWREGSLSLDEDPAVLLEALRQTTVLVNATPIGTRDPQASPLTKDMLDFLPGGAFVLDMVYNPPETALVRMARARGLRAVGGLDMLLYQGAEAFTLWTGHEAPLDVMRAALEQTQ